jgi:hypothetical protein
MKKRIPYLLALSLLIFFTACKKDATPEDTNTDMVTHSDDQSRFSTEIDAVANDADLAIESSSNFSGRLMDVQGLICDADIVVNTVSNPMTITITYNGANCLGNRTRTGVIVLSMPQGTLWKNAGAAITLSFQNYKVTRTSDTKSITINGTQTYTNVTGGLLINLPTAGPITHTLTSTALSVTFDNGSQRSWQVAKQRVFSFAGGVVVTASGIHTEGNVTNVAEWGTNRFGAAFTTSTLEPLVFRQDCNGRLVSGKVKHSTPNISATATFGLDVNGNPTTCPGAGTYYGKIVWTGPNGGSLSHIFPY